MKEQTSTSTRLTRLAANETFLAKILAKNYISIIEISLTPGTAIILKSALDAPLEGRSLPWSDLIEHYVQRRSYPEDQALVRSLTLQRLSTLLDQQQEPLSLELRCNANNEEYDWIEVNISVSSAAEKKLLLTTRNINERRMLKSLVDLFVYKNLDYCVLLDAKHNSATRFSGKKGATALPPTPCNDYTADLIHYNKLYVPAEDYDRTTANMQIPYVLKMLEKKEKYAFQSGVLTTTGEYRRSQVQFQYYDKAAKLILLTRMDITQAFSDEQIRSAQLATALRDAKLDSLTGLYNQKATAELVEKMLTRQYHTKAALFFIDIDNLKTINDTLGHQVGNKLLRFLSRALTRQAGRNGLAGRIGGDEFLLFLPLITTKKNIERCATNICQCFAAFSALANNTLPLSCSVGIAIYPQDGTDYATLCHKADQALYTSKRQGKNQFCFYANNMTTK